MKFEEVRSTTNRKDDSITPEIVHRSNRFRIVKTVKFECSFAMKSLIQMVLSLFVRDCFTKNFALYFSISIDFTISSFRFDILAV